jgi:MFS family permease
MKTGIAALALAYVLSQFFRTFLAVLSVALQADIGATPDDLSLASSIFFFTFAAAQIPTGLALDRFGPRLTAALPFGLLAGGGSLAVAWAQSPLGVQAGLALIGVGVAPILMATYFIFVRTWPSTIFATLAGSFVGFGSLGNLFGTIPLAKAVEWIGWRHAMEIVAGLSLLAALAVLALVRHPGGAPAKATKGGFLDLLKIRPLWPIMVMILVGYAPSISLRSVWMGPYLEDLHGLNTSQIGWASMGMALAMIVSLVTLGPIERRLGRKKPVVITCAAISVALFVALALWGDTSRTLAVMLFVAIGLFGSTYPMLISHGALFIPAHLTGRGVSLLNLFSIGGVSLFQWLAALAYTGTYPPVILTFAAALAAGLAVYLLARERP